MTTIFWLGNLLGAPFWLLMILLPRWRWTRRMMASPLVAAPHAALYVAVMVPQLRRVAPAVAKPTPHRVELLLSTSEGLTAGWLHLMMADLFIGRWIYLDAQEHNIPARLSSPVLCLALVFSPAGLLAYLGLRRTATRQ